MEFFSCDNCDFSDAQIKWANDFVTSKLNEWGTPDPGDTPATCCLYNENVKNACDLANDSLPLDI